MKKTHKPITITPAVRNLIQSYDPELIGILDTYPNTECALVYTTNFVRLEFTNFPVETWPGDKIAGPIAVLLLEETPAQFLNKVGYKPARKRKDK